MCWWVSITFTKANKKWVKLSGKKIQIILVISTLSAHQMEQTSILLWIGLIPAFGFWLNCMDWMCGVSHVEMKTNGGPGKKSKLWFQAGLGKCFFPSTYITGRRRRRRLGEEKGKYPKIRRVLCRQRWGGFLPCKMHGGARRTYLPLPTAMKLLRIHLITSTNGGCWLYQELQCSPPPYPIPDFHRSATTLIQSQQLQQHSVGALRLRWWWVGSHENVQQQESGVLQ